MAPPPQQALLLSCQIRNVAAPPMRSTRVSPMGMTRVIRRPDQHTAVAPMAAVDRITFIPTAARSPHANDAAAAALRLLRRLPARGRHRMARKRKRHPQPAPLWPRCATPVRRCSKTIRRTIIDAHEVKKPNSEPFAFVQFSLYSFRILLFPIH
jgi:hypothetical protein